jgi:aldehyde dehydrogenase (NAD+)
VSRVTEILKQTKIGPGMARDTQMGPLLSQAQRERVLRFLGRGKEAGAKAVLDGGSISPAALANGFYVQPALLEGSDENVCCREEIFGPCAYLLHFRDEESAVAERLVAGNSWINAHNLFAYGMPYGG